MYSGSSSLYSTPLYNTQALAQPSAYSLSVPQSASVYQPSLSYASPSYVSVQRPDVYAPRVYPAPLNAQVSTPAVYNAEHSSHASSSSVYKVQAPASVTYSVQTPRAQYVAAPNAWENNGNWAVGNTAGNSWNLNNPWC